MFGIEFKTWSANLFSNGTFITISIYIINLGYWENRPSCFTEFPDCGIKESNRIWVGLDIATIIPKTNNQDLFDLIDLEAKWANKKKEKVKRYQQRKINLIQAITANDTPLSPNASIYCPLLSFVTFTNSGGSVSIGVTGNAFADNIWLFLIISGSLLSVVSGCFSSFIASSSFLSTISGCFLSFITNGGSLSAVFDCLLSSVARSDPPSTISDHFLFFIPSNSLLSAISSGDYLFSIPLSLRYYSW